MGTMTESRIVQMSFDNEDFEKNVKQSLDTLSKLNEALEFKDGSHSLDEISNSAKRFDLSGISNSVEEANSHFSKLQVMGVTVLANLTNAAVNTGKQLLDSLVQPITTGGWQRALNMEQAKFMLNGLLGEEAKAAIGAVGEAGSIMDNIYKSVDGTIYSLDKAALVAARLMASNIVGTGENAELTRVLQAVAGVSSVFSADYERVGDLFSTIKSTGNLMGQQVLSFTTMGVPLYAKLAEYLNKITTEGAEAGKTLEELFPDNENIVKYLEGIDDATKITEADIKEMVSKSAISFDLFSDAMYDAFGDQASKSKEMYIGALEDMKAAAARIGEKFAKPLLGDSTSGVAGQLRDILNAMVPLLDSIGNRLNAEGGVIERWSNAIQNAGQKIVMVIDLISAAFDFDETSTQLQRLVDNGLADPSRLENLKKYAYQIERIKDVIYALGNVFSAAISILAAGFRIGKGVFEFFLGIAESLLLVLAGARSPLAEIKKNVKNWSKDLGTFLAKMTKVVLNSEFFVSIVTLITDAIKNLDKVVKKVGTSMKSFAESVSKVVDILATGLAKTIKKVHKELKGVFNLTDIINTTILGSLMIKVGKIFEFLKGEGMAFGSIFGDIQKRFGAGILNNLRKSSALLAEDLDQLRVTLVAYQKNLKAQILLKIAAALLALAVAVKILSSLNAQQLTQSIIALGVLGAVLTILMKRTLSVVRTLGRLDLKQLATLQLVKGVFIALALALIGMALAVKIMSTMDTDAAINGLLGLIVIAGTLYLLFRAMAKVQKVEGAAGIGRLLVIALALDMLALAFVGLGRMNWSGIKKASAAMGIIAGMIVVLQFITSKISKVQNVASVLPLIGMAVSISMLAGTFRKLAMLEWNQIKQGAASMAVALGSILLIMLIIGHVNPKSAIAGAIALGRIAGIIKTVFGVFKELGNMDYGTIKKAGIGLAVIEGAIAGLFLILRLISGKEGILGTTDIMASLAMAVLLSVIGKTIKTMGKSFIDLGNMEWGQIKKAAVGMAAILGIIAALAAASMLLAKIGGTKDLLMFAGTMVLLGLGFKVFAAGIKAMGSMQITTLGIGILGVAAAILVLNGVAKLVSKTFVDFLKMTAGMIAFGLGLAAIGAGAFVMGFGLASLASALKGLTMDDVLRIILLVGALALLSPIVKGVGASFLIFGAGVALVGVGLIAVGVGIAAIGLGFRILASSIGQAVESINTFANLDYTAVFKLAGLVTIFGLLSPLVLALGAGLLIAGVGMLAFGAGVKMVASALRAVKKLLDHVFDGIGESLVKKCKTAAKTLKDLIPVVKTTATALKKVMGEIKKVIKEISNLYNESYQAGKHVVDGVTAGVANNKSSAISAIRQMAREALQAYKDEMGISSPSKEMAKLARWTVLGYVSGINSNTDLAEASMTNFAKAMLNAYEYLNDNTDLTPTITPVVDTSQVESAVTDINSMMDSRRAISLSSDGSSITSSSSRLLSALTRAIGSEDNSTHQMNNYITVDGATDPDVFADKLLRSFRLNARTV